MGYEDIRAAVRVGFSVTNLHLITRLSHELLESDVPLRHPSAAYAIAATAQKVAWYCDDMPVREETADAIDAHIRPKMEAVLDAAEGETEPLMKALDELARAFMDAGPFLKSIGT